MIESGDSLSGALGDELEHILDTIYKERLVDEMRRLNELKQARIKQYFNMQVDRKVAEIEDLNDVIQPKLE